MKRPARIPHWRDLQALGGLGLLLIGGTLLLGLSLTFFQGLRSSMADSRSQPAPAPIDGERAYRYLKQICDLGPRPAGSAANTRQRQMVAAHFKAQGAEVREQPFTAPDPRTGEPVAMANLIGSWHPERRERALLAAHYDTRPFPDMDPDPAKRKGPFLGANDGASGVALLMEIAHHLKDLETPWGVDLVLFDGEELVYGELGEYFLGSKAFARAYEAEAPRARRAEAGEERPRYAAALVLDMVGDRDLTIYREQSSQRLAPALVRDVWAVAAALKARSFVNRIGYDVQDDHLPLNAAGIPAIDIIDFQYPAWHTAADLPDRCAPASLQEVGRVVTGWLSLPKPGRR